MKTMHVTENTPASEIKFWVREQIINEEPFCIPYETPTEAHLLAMDVSVEVSRKLSDLHNLVWVNLSRVEQGLLFTPVTTKTGKQS